MPNVVFSDDGLGCRTLSTRVPWQPLTIAFVRTDAEEYAFMDWEGQGMGWHKSPVRLIGSRLVRGERHGRLFLSFASEAGHGTILTTVQALTRDKDSQLVNMVETAPDMLLFESHDLTLDLAAETSRAAVGIDIIAGWAIDFRMFWLFQFGCGRVEEDTPLVGELLEANQSAQESALLPCVLITKSSVEQRDGHLVVELEWPLGFATGHVEIEACLLDTEGSPRRIFKRGAQASYQRLVLFERLVDEDLVLANSGTVKISVLGRHRGSGQVGRIPW